MPAWKLFFDVTDKKTQITDFVKTVKELKLSKAELLQLVNTGLLMMMAVVVGIAVLRRCDCIDPCRCLILIWHAGHCLTLIWIWCWTTLLTFLR